MSETIRLIAEFFAACIGTIAFALLFQVPRKYYLYCGIAGACGWICYKLILPYTTEPVSIFFATYEAMREAVSKLSREPDLLLNDAVTIPEMTIMQVPIIKGDAKSVSIAAASILAKVTRDRLMIEYDKILPEYGFAGHKGYGSKEHIAAIQKYGPSPIHRRTFIKNFM